MSLFKKVFSGAKKLISSPAIRAVAPILGGPIGTSIALAGTAYQGYQAAKSFMPAQPQLPSMSAGMFPGLSLGGPLATAGRVAGVGVGMGIRGAKRIYSSAASYCRKHPGWCQTIGGIAAVEALIQNGQLPVMKSRRGRGISATELKHFKRVARFTSKYCAPVRKAMSSRALRGKSCR